MPKFNDIEYYRNHPQYENLIKKYVHHFVNDDENKLPFYKAQLILFIKYYNIELLDNETPEDREKRIEKELMEDELLIDDYIESIVYPAVSNEIDIYEEVKYEYI
jgi:hypothetical protein